MKDLIPSSMSFLSEYYLVFNPLSLILNPKSLFFQFVN